MKRACPVSEANSSSATDTGKMRVILLGLEGTAALDVWSALRARITERKSLQMAQRILVVEDEPAISESVAYALKRDGFSVVTAAMPVQARAAAVSNPTDAASSSQRAVSVSASTL